METKTQNKNKVAEESLKKTMAEGNEPSVENLMLALNQANTKIKQMQMQMAKMAEAYNSLQFRVATEEFKTRLEYLWRVLFEKDTEKVFEKEFIERCAVEFEDMLFPVMQEEETEEK